MNEGMNEIRRWAACIEYDGTAYHGWQSQPHAASVQETLETALSRVAAAMTGSLGENGIVARHGGEEFAVLLPETDPEAGYALAERLRCDIARLRDLPAPVTISIGLGPCPPGSGQDDIARAELIALADRALYAAKAAGRNRVVTARR